MSEYHQYFTGDIGWYSDHTENLRILGAPEMRSFLLCSRTIGVHAIGEFEMSCISNLPEICGFKEMQGISGTRNSTEFLSF